MNVVVIGKGNSKYHVLLVVEGQSEKSQETSEEGKKRGRNLQEVYRQIAKSLKGHTDYAKKNIQKNKTVTNE